MLPTQSTYCQTPGTGRRRQCAFRSVAARIIASLFLTWATFATSARGRGAEVDVLHIDGTVWRGEWIGADGSVALAGTVTVRGPSGPVDVPFHDLARLTFSAATVPVPSLPITAGQTVGSTPTDASTPADKTKSDADGPQVAPPADDDKKATKESVPSEPATPGNETPKQDNVVEEATGPVPAIFHLADGGLLPGKLIDPPAGDVASDAVYGRTALAEVTALPFDRVAAIQLGRGDEFPRAFRAFRSALANRLPGRDVLIVRSVDDAKTLRGQLVQIGTQTGSFSFAGRCRSFQTGKIFGVVFAGGGGIDRDDRFGVTASLLDGSVFSGNIVDADASAVRLASSIGQTATIRVSDISRLECVSNRVVYVSDIEPSAQTVEGLLHRTWPIRFDRSVGGGPLVIDGEVFARGIGVHSRTTLTYSLDGGFQSFVATIGLDDAVRPGGSVIFRVSVDGNARFESQELTGRDEAQLIKIDIAGARTLTLVVDFGKALDLGDHADWAGARLIRPAPDAPDGARQ